MADVDGGLVARNLVKLGVDLRLGNRVERGCRLVEDDERRVFVQCPGDGNLLRLAAGNLHALVGKILVELGVQPLGQPLQPLAKAGVNQRLLHPLAVIVGRARHVLAQRLGEQLEVLEHHREDVHVLAVVVFADVDAV